MKPNYSIYVHINNQNGGKNILAKQNRKWKNDGIEGKDIKPHQNFIML